MAPRLVVIVGAVAVAVVAAALSGWWHLANAFERFDAEMSQWQSQVLLISEQHAAHLTALAAVRANAGDTVFGLVAEQIEQAYPRIVSIQSNSDTHALLSSESAGMIRLVEPSPGGSTQMTIDAASLLPQDTSALWAGISLADGTFLGGDEIDDPAFEAAVDSRTLHVILSASPKLIPATLFPTLPTLLAVLVALLTYGMAVLAWRQWNNARRAERRALLGEQMARLEHASRVNALGEMAAGIAHEITQPLTAILGQAQAGRRLLDRGDVDATRAVLDETVLQSKRAAAIMERLRKWIRFEEQGMAITPLRPVIDNVVALLASQLAQRGVRLDLQITDPGLSVRADAVQLEQVLFNLVRNAIEAVPAVDGRVGISSGIEGGRVIIVVSDNGPGLEEGVRTRLFEPFVTTKDEGLGLGLVLCQRLVERMGGSIVLSSNSPTTFQIILPTPDGASK